MTAHCADLPKDMFFPSPDDRATYTGRIATAKQVCDGCPLQLACYQAAVARNEQYGIWGGVLFLPTHQRKAWRKNRCGTDTGYTAHLRRGEPACGECTKAHALAQALRRENLNAR